MEVADRTELLELRRAERRFRGMVVGRDGFGSSGREARTASALDLTSAALVPLALFQTTEG